VSSSSQPEDEAPWPDQRYAWFVVIVLYLGAVLSLMDRQIISLLVGDIKQHLGLTDFEIGLLQGPPFGIFYALMSIPIARRSWEPPQHHRAGDGFLVAGNGGVWTGEQLLAPVPGAHCGGCR
jgi:hypothetical protein